MSPSSAPLVSVIMAAYNPGMRIAQALQSVKDQTFKDVEVVVIDDGSSQDVRSLIEPFSDLVTYLRSEENRGPAAARNLGIRHTTGRYVAVLDSDDVWMPDRLEALVEVLEQDPQVGFAATDILLMFGDSKSSRSWFSTLATLLPDEGHDVSIFSSNFVSSLLIYRRTLFARHGLYDESLRIGEDWDRAIAFLSAGEKFHLIRQPLAYYRVTPDSTSRNQKAAVAARIQVLQKWLSLSLSPAQVVAASASLNRARWDMAKVELEENGRSSTLEDLMRSASGSLLAKALIARAIPKIFLFVRGARHRFLEERGGNWVLHDAMDAIDSGDRGKAIKPMQGVVIFSFPARIRLLAMAWLAIPPARSLIRSRLKTDRLVGAMTQWNRD